MNSAIQQSITSAISSVVAIAIATIQIKHKNLMLSLHEMIEKSFLLRNFSLTIPPPDSDASAKVSTVLDNSTKMTKRWNEATLGYFDSHLDKAHRKGEIVLVGKDIYYRNVVFLSYASKV